MNWFLTADHSNQKIRTTIKYQNNEQTKYKEYTLSLSNDWRLLVKFYSALPHKQALNESIKQLTFHESSQLKKAQGSYS